MPEILLQGFIYITVSSVVYDGENIGPGFKGKMVTTYLSEYSTS